jgi:flavodoxin I
MMKALIVYDSVEGNTEKIARAMADALAPHEMKMARPAEASALDLKSFGLLIVGSPTFGGRPTQPIQAFLTGLPADGLKGMDVLAFDTRLKAAWVKIFGYAAEKIARILTDKGGKALAPPAGFIVTGSKGPLKDGELERAAGWVKALLEGKK